MIKQLKKWYNYVFAFILIIIVEAIAIIPHFVINDSSIWPKVYISYISLLAAVIYAGGGFIAQDIYRGIKRKETKNWDFPLEDKYIETAWRIYLPFLLAGITLLLGGLISYPFLK